MNRSKISIWCDISLPNDLLELGSEIDLLSAPSRDGLDGLEVADAAIVGSGFRGTAESLDRAGDLLAICRFGIGVDNIDLNAATERGICIMNTPDAPTTSVAEVTVCMIIGLVHRVVRAHETFATTGWTERESLLGEELADLTVGLVGFGRTGSRTAKLLSAFGCELVAFDPYIDDSRFASAGMSRASDLPELLRVSDVVSLHAPSTPGSQSLINSESLGMMKPGSYLVNVSRGSLVDTSAVAAALNSGRLAGAALDVWIPEPPGDIGALGNHPSVIHTPHIAGASRQAMSRSFMQALDQISDVVSDRRPQHLVNQEVWQRRRSIADPANG